MSKPRTIEDVMKDWSVMASGTTVYEGRQPRDWELAWAEIRRLRKELARPAPVVLIEVSGGVADWHRSGKVDVALLDWDNVEAGDVCKLSRRHRDLLTEDDLAKLDRLNEANAGHEP